MYYTTLIQIIYIIYTYLEIADSLISSDSHMLECVNHHLQHLKTDEAALYAGTPSVKYYYDWVPTRTDNRFGAASANSVD
jgi:hypothetical protein